MGLVRVGDEEAAIGLREHGAVRRATGLVWRQYMLREFDRAVAANEIALFARVGSAIAPFKALPSDVWPLLTILDWQNAIARDPEGLLFYSLHAQLAKVAISTARDERYELVGQGDLKVNKLGTKSLICVTDTRNSSPSCSRMAFDM